MKRQLIIYFKTSTPLALTEIDKLKTSISECLCDMEQHISTEEIEVFERIK